jgi:ribose 5-phosphate isomerase RpiB
MLDIFMNTAFEGGRHANRVEKIACWNAPLLIEFLPFIISN